MSITIIVPFRLDVLAWLQKNDADERHCTDSGLYFGNPTVEREGVTERRMAFCHPFTEEDAGAIRSDFKWAAQRLSAKLGMSVKDILEKYVTFRRGGGLPDDWRYPTE